MFTDLLHSSYFSLFLIVALGFMLGRIKIKGLSLDVSAVIFIALLFGHFGVIIPKELGNFGLVLFIFTIGIQAGPGFFDSFRSKGKTLIIITMLIISSACLTAVGLKYAFGIDTPSVVGLVAGALTSTPGLAVAIDSTNSPLASIAYGIAYPFGVIGVILFVKLLPKIMRIDLDKEARRLEIERRGQFPAADPEGELSGTFPVVPGGDPVERPDVDPVGSRFREFDRRHGVRHGFAHAVRDEVGRTHLVHELLVHGPPALVAETLGLDQDAAPEGGGDGQQQRCGKQCNPLHGFSGVS